MTGPSSYPLRDGGMRAFQARRKQERLGRPPGSLDSGPRNLARTSGGETVRQARELLDDRFPWLRGVEKAVR
jgi:hypothetical protein